MKGLLAWLVLGLLIAWSVEWDAEKPEADTQRGLS